MDTQKNNMLGKETGRLPYSKSQSGSIENDHLMDVSMKKEKREGGAREADSSGNRSSAHGDV